MLFTPMPFGHSLYAKPLMTRTEGQLSDILASPIMGGGLLQAPGSRPAFTFDVSGSNATQLRA
jgi:hypothetical protein